MSVVISPATTTRPVVISVSQATRPAGSSVSTASSTASEIWSATLSGCPSVTDSEVKRNSRGAAIRRLRLLDLEKRVEGAGVARAGRPFEERAQRPEVRGHLGRELRSRQPCEALDQRNRVLQVEVEEAARVAREPGRLLRFLEIGAVGEALARRADPGDPGGVVRDHDLPVLDPEVELELRAERK